MYRFWVLLLFLLMTVPVTPDAIGTEPVGGRDQARERLEILRMWKMMEALNLDKATADKIFEIRRKYVKEQKQIRKALEDDLQKLRYLLREDSAGSDDRQLGLLVGHIREQRQRLHALWSEQYEEVSKVLSVRQQAELTLFLKDFNRDIRSLLRPPPPRLPNTPSNRPPEMQLRPPRAPLHAPDSLDGPPEG